MKAPKSLLLPANIGKVIILILGITLLGVGLHSHFQSSWVKDFGDPPDLFKAYEICTLRIALLEPIYREAKCPSISLERYTCSIIILTFLFSFTGYIAGFLADLQIHPLKLIDLFYHILCVPMLLIAAVVYIVSSVQIDHLVKLDGTTDEELRAEGIDFRKSEKIAAALLNIVALALDLYAVKSWTLNPFLTIMGFTCLVCFCYAAAGFVFELDAGNGDRILQVVVNVLLALLLLVMGGLSMLALYVFTPLIFIIGGNSLEFKSFFYGKFFASIIIMIQGFVHILLAITIAKAKKPAAPHIVETPPENGAAESTDSKSSANLENDNVNNSNVE